MSLTRGFSPSEILLVTAVTSLILSVTASVTLPHVTGRNSRSSAYEIETYLQLARVEAVHRGHDCRLRIDPTARTLQVLDSRGTASPADDVVLYERVVSSHEAFACPGETPEVATEPSAPPFIDTVFSAQGRASATREPLCLHGDGGYRRVTVTDSAAIRVEHWSGAAWDSDS